LARVWLRHGRELWLRFGWIDDVEFAVVIDRGVGAEEQAADVCEDGGATRRDAVFGDEFKEIGEGVIDALRGLETLAGLEEEFGMVCLGREGLGELGVMRTEGRVGGGGQTALLELAKRCWQRGAELAMLLMGLGLVLMADLEGGVLEFGHRQSRWLSKERSCGRGKRDGCEKKGVSQN